MCPACGRPGGPFSKGYNGGVRYFERAPIPALADEVECIWFLSGEVPEGAPVTEKILPDGCPELILHRGNPGQLATAEGGFRRQARMSVAGQLRRFVRLRLGPRVDLLGVRFHPAGAARVFGPHVDLFSESLVPLDSLHPSLARACGAALEARSAAAAASRVEAALVDVLPAATALDLAAHHAVTRLVQSAGRVRIAEVAAELGMTGRHLRRLFRPRVGLGPKELARVLRFQSVFQAVEHSPRAAWSRIALAAGYADQAHLIRDFADLAGSTPPRLLGSAGELTHAFTRAGRN